MWTLGVVELDEASRRGVFRYAFRSFSRGPSRAAWIPAGACPRRVLSGAGMTKQRHATPPIRHSRWPAPNFLSRGRESTFSAVATAPPLCPPTKTFEGRHPGGLVSPLQDIIYSGRCLVVQYNGLYKSANAPRNILTSLTLSGVVRVLHQFCGKLAEKAVCSFPQGLLFVGSGELHNYCSM